jgi:hypothetical protein
MYLPLRLGLLYGNLIRWDYKLGQKDWVSGNILRKRIVQGIDDCTNRGLSVYMNQ